LQCGRGLRKGQLAGQERDPQTYLGGRAAAVESQARIEGSETLLANRAVVTGSLERQHTMRGDDTARLPSFVAGEVSALSAAAALGFYRFALFALLVAVLDQILLDLLAEGTTDLACRLFDLVKGSRVAGQLFLELAAHYLEQFGNQGIARGIRSVARGGGWGGRCGFSRHASLRTGRRVP